MKKIWLLLTIFTFSLCLISCGSNEDDTTDDLPPVNDTEFDESTSNIYKMAKEAGYTGTYEEWLETIKGAPGKSAYEVSVENGYTGTVQEWLEMLKGSDGKNVELSVQNGFIVWKNEGSNSWTNLLSIESLKGTSGREIELSTTTTHVVWRYVGDINWNNLIGLEIINQNPTSSSNGKSAYELAVELGFEGSIDEWLDSLKGAPGKTPEFSVVDEYLCWRYVGDENWIRLFPINSIGSGNLQEVHTVTYVDELGNVLLTQEVLDGKKAIQPQNVILTNGDEAYAWKIGDEMWSFIGYTVTEDITLVAITRPHHFEITYELNNGVIEGTYVESFTKEHSVNLPRPVLIGHVFKGWYLEDTFVTRVTNTSELPLRDVKLYAKFEVNETSCAEDPTQDNCQYVDTWTWNYNRTGFDGKGMEVILYTGDLEADDPFNDNYTKDRKLERQRLINTIEEAYNIDLVIERYPANAAWGISRIEWIKENHYTGNNGPYIYTIVSEWAPILAQAEAIAEVYNMQEDSGIFKSLSYTQKDMVNDLFSANNKVYGYSIEDIHADMFMYYNQSLVDEYGLEDPATLWNEGKWDWSTFVEYLIDAHTVFNQNSSDELIYSFSSELLDSSSEWLGARGLKFIDEKTHQVLFNNSNIHQLFSELRNIYQMGLWDPYTMLHDVPQSFTSGNLLFTSGDLWFLESPMRFKNQTSFDIGVVPYPTKTGNAVTYEKVVEDYLVPVYTLSGYCFSNIENGTNGLTAEVLVNICDDFCRGLKPEFNEDEYSKRDQYIKYLSTIISGSEERVSQIITAIMSVEDNLDAYAYHDLMYIVSATIGQGSQFMNDAYGTWCSQLIRSEDDPSNILRSKQYIYQNALEDLIQ